MDDILNRCTDPNLTTKPIFIGPSVPTDSSLDVYADFAAGLSRKETELLYFFRANPGRVISRVTLLENVWHYVPFQKSNTVEVHLSSLRSKLKKAFKNRQIKTIRGIGYVME